jgi:hypothetical protein
MSRQAMFRQIVLLTHHRKVVGYSGRLDSWLESVVEHLAAQSEAFESVNIS